MNNISLLLIAAYVCFTALLISFYSKQNRWKALLFTSSIFYCTLIGYKFLVVLFLAILIYGFSYAKKIKPLIAICILITPLLIFKGSITGNHFENYNSENIRSFSKFQWSEIFQVLGLSYFVFNGISYLIDLKRGYIQVEKNFFLLLLYLIYFPTVFAGPLHRAKYMFSRFQNIEITNTSISNGLRLVLWGLFKNLVVAQGVYSLMTKLPKEEFSGIYFVLSGFFFSIFLYCSFSSFVDFFQGVSEVFGIELKDNFGNRVYLSRSRQQFWKNWHITLNEWFRDYFFFEITKYDKKRKYTNLIVLITFILIALWHEMSLVFLMWGLLNGLWIVIEKQIDFEKWPYPNFRKIAGPFYNLFVGSLTFLPFISPDLNYLKEKLLSPAVFPLTIFQNNIEKIMGLIFLFLVMDYYYAKAGDLRFDKYIGEKSKLSRWTIYFGLTFLILAFGKLSGINNYYIQF